MTSISDRRFSLFCDFDGHIKTLFHNEGKVLSESVIGNTIFSLCLPSDLNKTIEFYLDIKNNNSSAGWEINLNTPEGYETFSFVGGVFGEMIGIAASTTKQDASLLMAELSSINNEQMNTIRQLVKEKQKLQQESDDIPGLLFDDLSRLNNELVNMQRELAKKNRELDELNKLKNKFLGMAAHDLRSPLGVIIGYSNFILEDEVRNFSKDQLEMIESILSSSEFMLNLLNELLDVSAIESGEIKLNMIHH